MKTKLILIAILFSSCTHSYYRQQVQLYQENGQEYIREVSPQYRVANGCPVTFDSQTNTYTICKKKGIAIRKEATFLVKK